MLKKSKNGKVTYEVADNHKRIFEYKMYSYIFKKLDSMERKLPEPLEFNVHINESVLDFFRNCYPNPNSLDTMCSKIGIRIFELINDISLSQAIYAPCEVEILCSNANALKDLKKFYNKYASVIHKCANRDITSLSLYGVLTNNSYPFALLGNIVNTINNPCIDFKVKEVACEIIMEAIYHLKTLESNKECEYYFYEVFELNKKFAQIEDFKVDESTTVDDIYKFLYSDLK